MRRAVFFAFLLVVSTVLCGASSDLSSVAPQHQFHFRLIGRRAAASAQVKAPVGSPPSNRHALPFGIAGAVSAQTTANQTSTGQVRQHPNSNPPLGKIGFVSATQIPIGAGFPSSSLGGAIPGDFNGDGKLDFASIVVTASGTYLISIGLGNGDGTFQPPVLTPVPGGDGFAQLMAADITGDGKADLLVIHQSGNAGYNSSCFDVLAGMGDGTLAWKGNYSITYSDLAAGTLVDVNGDGKLDMVAVDQNNPAGVWTMLGNGDGTFSPSTAVALTGGVSFYTVFADFNGDGLLDIASMVANNTFNNQLTVYLAASATAYASPATYNTPDGIYNACSITAGDLNGDGKPEIVNANCNDDTITVYSNNGDGTFGSPAYPSVYYDAAAGPGIGNIADVYPDAVSVADVNGDGKPDIVSTNYESGDVTILLNDGNGGIMQVPTVGYAVGGGAPGPSYPAIIADFNGDGFADMLVQAGDFGLTFLQGYGDGTFRSGIDYYSPVATSPSVFSQGIATGDFNGDGVPDFVIGNNCDSPCAIGITVFLSRPDGSMQPGVNYGSTGYLGYVAVADFNKDGKLDIAATDYYDGFVQIYTGNGDGTFATGLTFPTDASPSYPEGLIAGDFNHDGYPDLAVQNYEGNDVAVLLNDGSGNFLAPVIYPLSVALYPSYQGMAAADLNGDGNLDLVVPANYGGAVGIFLGKGDGTFGPESDLSVGSSSYSYPTAISIADLNGDGKPDLAVTIGQFSPAGAQGIAVALGKGDGTFQSPVLYATSLQNFNLLLPFPSFLQVADIDGDGKPDLVYTNNGYGTVGVLFGLGNGTFYDPVEYPAADQAYGLVVADVNQDGSPDVVAGGAFSGVTVLLNQNGSATRGNYTVTITQWAATITAGSSAVFNFTITPTKRYNGIVTLSCGALPALATCTFNPQSVTLDGLAPQTIQLTIATTAVSASLQAPVDFELHSPGTNGSAILFASLAASGLIGVVFLGGSNKRAFRLRSGRIGFVLAGLILAILFAPACGGSSSSTTTQQTPPAPLATTTTLTSSSNTITLGQSVTLTGKVSAASGSPTGTLTFLDGSTSLGAGAITSGTATLKSSSLAAGIHTITASYSGDPNFKPSASAATTQTVDNPGTASGTYTVTVTATGTPGSNNGNTSAHPLNLTVVVQ